MSIYLIQNIYVHISTMGAAPRLLCFTIIFSEVLPILRTIRGSPYFPRQLELETKVHMKVRNHGEGPY